MNLNSVKLIGGRKGLQMITVEPDDGQHCFRCGRNKHILEQCTQKYDISGKLIITPSNEYQCGKCGLGKHYKENCYKLHDKANLINKTSIKTVRFA
jgi:hypothetical protein